MSNCLAVLGLGFAFHGQGLPTGARPANILANGEIHLFKEVDTAFSPWLVMSAATASRWDTVRIEVYAPSCEPRPCALPLAFKLELTNVLVTAVAVSASVGARAVESVVLSYDRLTVVFP